MEHELLSGDRGCWKLLFARKPKWHQKGLFVCDQSCTQKIARCKCKTNLCELEMLEHCYYSPLKTLCKENNVPTYFFFFFLPNKMILFILFFQSSRKYSAQILAWTLWNPKIYLFYQSKQKLCIVSLSSCWMYLESPNIKPHSLLNLNNSFFFNRGNYLFWKCFIQYPNVTWTYFTSPELILWLWNCRRPV